MTRIGEVSHEIAPSLPTREMEAGARVGLALLLIVFFCNPMPAWAQTRTGMASWYSYESTRREGNSGIMANGEVMNDHGYTAASWDFGFGTRLLVTTRTIPQKSITVVVSDRGPARSLYRRGRLLDLSPAAFQALAPLEVGVLQVEIKEVQP